MPTTFFERYPKVAYSFGDNEAQIEFQNLSVYIDAIDQVREYGSFYQNYQIQNGERPDQVSKKIYGTTEYYWTFYLMNERLRVNGWPITNSQLYNQVQLYYPNICAITDGTSFLVSDLENIPLCRSETAIVGGWVWYEQSKKAAKILRIDQDLGMLHLDLTDIPNNPQILYTIDEESALIIRNEDPDYTPLQIYEQLTVVRTVNQWDAPHHYEDADGNWIFPTYSSVEPYIMNQVGVTTSPNIAVTYFDRFREINDESRSIRVLKTDVVRQVVSEYNSLLLKQK